MAPLASIPNHVIVSLPRPHIAYVVNVTINDITTIVQRRYSEFLALHESLEDKSSFPPKRFLNAILPATWVGDSVLTERKEGLSEWLNIVLNAPETKDKFVLLEFLKVSDVEIPSLLDVEDGLPTSMTPEATFAPLGGEITTQAAPLNCTYYPDWVGWTYGPEKLDFSKFDIIFFAFAMPSSTNGIYFESTDSTNFLKRLVTAARNSGKGTKIVLSVGGWGGCRYFSQACSSAANRSTFSKALVNAVNTYGLDGVDLDWEYPNNPGAGNPYSPNDAANLLSLFKSLRSSLGASKIISAAVSHLPWLGADGRSLTNVKDFADVMTYVNIMNYDVWGASANPGPNAPEGNLCKTSRQPQASAQAAFNQWTAAGFPPSKLLLGLPLYGYVSKSSKTVLTGSSVPAPAMSLLQTTSDNHDEEHTKFVNGAHPRSREAESSADETAKEGGRLETETKAEGLVESFADANLTQYWGQQLAFKKIYGSGALVKGADGNFRQGGGFTMGWDDCSNTPYLFNVAQTTVVSYDDTWSLSSKARLAKAKGMAGCFTWSIDQDNGFDLTNSILKGLGR